MKFGTHDTGPRAAFGDAGSTMANKPSRNVRPEASPSADSQAQPRENASKWDKTRALLIDELGEMRVSLLMQGVANFLPQFCFNRLRTALWRTVNLKIGAGSLVMGELVLSGSGDWSSLLSVGADTYISGPLRINLGGSVRIGSGVNIGHDCLLLTVDHEIGGPDRRAGWSTCKPIVIEDGAWIASKVVILPGVTVGRGAVVAAGSVVTKNVPANTLVGGIPAKVMRQLSQ
jgi:maltose O-acetyltransferase